MARNLFLGKAHSVAYHRFRPTPPQQLLERILHYVQEKIGPPLRSAVDVGCGSGQSTLILSPHFQHVLGMDVSHTQLAQAKLSSEGLSNVAFGIARAEELPVENGTVQLITAAQCFHWFDADKFYSETKRILVPDGVLAVYTYLLPQIKTGNTSLDRKLYDQLMKLYSGSLGSYWDPARYMIDRRYNNVRLPFSDAQRVDGIWASRTSSIADYQGYLSTWSGYQRYVKVKGQEAGTRLLVEFTRRLMETLQSSKSEEETVVQVDIEYFLLLGRNPSAKEQHHAPS